MSTFAQNNFLIRHQYRDFFSDIQRNKDRIGNVGKESDPFVKRAFKQFKDHNFHDLAKTQDSFIPEDETAGTRFREDNRNYNRMEYDMPNRQDGKEHADVMKNLDTHELKIKDVLNAFDKQGYTVVSTATAFGTDPVEKKDYEGQINLEEDPAGDKEPK